MPTPSATMLMPARISSSERPLPSSKPTWRLRLSAPLQVRTRSPRPARPLSVSGLAPKLDGQARHLRQAARDQRRQRIRAKAQPLASACGNGHDIFHRAGELHAEHVVVGVQAKSRSGKFFLKISGRRSE